MIIKTVILAVILINVVLLYLFNKWKNRKDQLIQAHIRNYLNEHNLRLLHLLAPTKEDWKNSPFGAYPEKRYRQTHLKYVTLYNRKRPKRDYSQQDYMILTAAKENEANVRVWLKFRLDFENVDNLVFKEEVH